MGRGVPINSIKGLTLDHRPLSNTVTYYPVLVASYTSHGSGDIGHSQGNQNESRLHSLSNQLLSLLLSKPLCVVPIKDACAPPASSFLLSSAPSNWFLDSVYPIKAPCNTHTHPPFCNCFLCPIKHYNYNILSLWKAIRVQIGKHVTMVSGKVLCVLLSY